MAVDKSKGAFHLGGWFQNVNPANVFTALNAILDPQLTTNGKDVRVPKDLPFVLGRMAWGNDASFVQAELTSPSLRSMFPLDIDPINASEVVPNEWLKAITEDSPVPVVPDESLNMFVLSNPAGAVDHYGFVWLSDGPMTMVKGQIFSIRATAAATLVAGTWVPSALTFQTVLPAGAYSIVGMRARSANLLAARLILVGGTWRPGCIASAAIGAMDQPEFRYGWLGSWGTFLNTTPPQVEFMGKTDTSQVVMLDLIKVA